MIAVHRSLSISLFVTAAACTSTPPRDASDGEATPTPPAPRTAAEPAPVAASPLPDPSIERAGAEIELAGRFAIEVGEPGTKSGGERSVEFVADDGRSFIVHNLGEAEIGAPGRAVKIRAREVELSRFAAHRGGPRVWVVEIVEGEPTARVDASSKMTPVTTPYAATNADLDGDGKSESISLGRDGRLAIGTATETVVWLHPPADYWGGLDHENRLVVVDLDGKRKGVMFWQFEEGDVDPDKRYEVFGYRDGAIKRLTPAPVPAAHASEVSLGRGRVTIVEDSCAVDSTLDDAGMPKADGKSRRVVRTLRYDAARDVYVVGEKTTTKRARCIMAACPFVEVQGVQIGEILRRLSEPSAEGSQSLALPPASGRVEVTLAERKPEWSAIDAVALRVDGTIVLPRECDTVPTLCADDGVARTLGPGEAMTLSFDIGTSSDIVLLVDGHYVPLAP